MTTLAVHLTGWAAVYIYMLAAFTGWIVIGRVPAILHTPLMSGSNFIHGIVVVGGLFTLLNAADARQQVFGFAAVLLGACNAAGAYAVTARMLAMFQASHKNHPDARPARARKPS